MNLNLELSAITKVFGEKIIYNKLNYTFTQGCYAVYGENGVGKTLLLQMIAGVLPQDEGVINLNSTISSGTLSYKSKLVYVPSTPSFFPMVDGMEYLSFISSLKPSLNPKIGIQDCISGYKLSQHLSTKFSRMSLGTQKKLFLSTLAIGDNNLIVLDEPTNGLDDESIHFFRESIKAFSREAIVIIATHDTAFMSGIDHTAIRLVKTPISDFQSQG